MPAYKFKTTYFSCVTKKAVTKQEEAKLVNFINIINLKFESVKNFKNKTCPLRNNLDSDLNYLLDT